MNAIAQTSRDALAGSKLDNRRMLAAVIDLAIVGVGGAAILFAAGVLGGDGGSVGAPLAGVVVCWALYYHFACESGGGQTLGKRLTRVRVVRVDGSPAGMREIAVRTALRVIDTVLVGLIAILATGERRARLGDLAAGTMIVSTDLAGPGPEASAPVAEPEPVATRWPVAAVAVAPEPVAVAPEPVAVAPEPVAVAPEPVAAPELRPFEPFAEPAETPDGGAPAHPAPEELAEREPLEEVADGEPVVEYEPITRLEPVVEAEPVVEVEPVVEAEPVAEPEPGPVVEVQPEPIVDDAEPGPSSPQLSVVTEPAVELSIVETQPRVELVTDDPPASAPEAPSADHTHDVATPSLKELAQDVDAATGSTAAEREPVVEVEVAGPDIDVDEPDVTVRSVETVSAIDLVMGADDPSDEPPAGNDPPAVA